MFSLRQKMGLKRTHRVAFPHGVSSSVAAAAGAMYAMARKRARSSSSRSSSRSAPSSGRSVRLTFRRGNRRNRNKRKRQRGGSDNQLASGKDVTGFTHKVRGIVSKKKFTFISAKHVYRYNASQRLTQNGSAQNADMLGRANATGVFQAGLFNVRDVNNIRNVMATIQTPASVGVNSSTQFAVPVGRAEYQISNSTNANIMIWLYDVIPRKMIYVSDTNYDNPVNAWVNGMRVQAGTGGGASVATIIGCKPFESKLFCENYHVKSVKKVVLSPGVVHRHIVKSTQRRWYSDTQYNNQFIDGVVSSNALWFGGRTVLTMIVIAGLPGHSRANPVSATTTTTPVGIDVVSTKTYEFMWSATAAKTVIWADQLPGPAPDIEVVPEAQGAFNTVVTA